MKLATDLAATLRTLAEKVERGQIRGWQLSRLADALAPEMRLVAQMEAVELPVRVVPIGAPVAREVGRT